MDQEVTRARDILKTSDILTCKPSDTLKNALSKLTRSHDAVFVMDGKKFLGCISPYYSIFKSKFPPDTKVSNCLYKPPKISQDAYVWDIAKLMLESKIYYLPVFDRSHFLGIVTINRVLKAVQSDPVCMNLITLDTSNTPVTIAMSTTVGKAYSLMRDKQISRLPVVDSHGKLVGITTRYDIQFALSEPKERMRWMSKSGNKNSVLETSLEGYVKKFVITAPQEAGAKRIISLIIDKNVGSVVLIGKQRKPAGIISIHDVLKSISALKPTNTASFSVHTSDEFVNDMQLETLVSSYYKKFTKQFDIGQLRVDVKTKKNPSGKVNNYSVSVETKKGSKKIYAKVTEREWKLATRKAFEKVKQQLLSAKKAMSNKRNRK